MQKKILTLLVLLMTAVTGAWADTTVTWEGTKLQGIAVCKGYNYGVTTESMTVDGITITANKGYLINDLLGVSLKSGAANGVVFSAENNIKSITITSTGFSQFTPDGSYQMSGGSHTYEVSPAATSYGFPNDVDITGITKIEITLEPAPEYYLVGNITSWGIDPQYKLALNESAGDANEYQIAVALPAATELKVVSSTDGSTIKDWYPAGQGGNKVVENDGLYTIYFRPGYNGGSDWHAGCIYVADGVSFTADGTAWTLAQMPACDLEMEVEYYPLATLATTPAAAEGLNDATTADLLTPGTSNEGTLYYALGTSEAPTGQWSQTIPTTEGLEAGEYYVWYKVVGDDQHSDSQPQSIAVTVAALPAFAVTIEDAGVDASNWQATPAEQRAGQTVTLSYGGKKKVRSITIEAAPTAPAGITWDSSTYNVLWVSSGSAYTAGDITLSVGSSSQNYASGSMDFIEFTFNDAGGFTFTAPSGKKFTKIEMIPYDEEDIEKFYDTAFMNGIGTGWSSASEIAETGIVTWTGEAQSVDMLNDVNGYSCKVSKIVFTLE